MADYSVVAKRLREARTRTGVSQKQLGIKAGFDEFSASPRVNQYERGKHTPDVSTAERLARVLGVPAAFLYCRDDDLAKLILAWPTLKPAGRRRLAIVAASLSKAR